jgi:hypothetical protein
MGIWDELGLDGDAADAKAVRKAYATRLRAIDPDADPASFQRLRAAYERALYVAAGRAQARTREEEAAPVAVLDAPRHAPPVREDLPPPPQAEAPTLDALEHERVEREINAALTAKDSRSAMRLLTTALAQGVLRLGERELALEAIMPQVIGDKTLGPREYLHLLEESGWSLLPRRGETVSATRRAAVARGEAEAWYLRLQEFAARDAFRGDSHWHDWRAARLLLQGDFYFPLRVRSAAPLERTLLYYGHYAPWIGHRFDPRFIARGEATVRWCKVANRALLVILVVITALIAIAGALAAISGLSSVPLVAAVFVGRWAYGALQRLPKRG